MPIRDSILRLHTGHITSARVRFTCFPHRINGAPSTSIERQRAVRRQLWPHHRAIQRSVKIERRVEALERLARQDT
jgi:hypothetical protein